MSDAPYKRQKLIDAVAALNVAIGTSDPLTITLQAGTFDRLLQRLDLTCTAEMTRRWQVVDYNGNPAVPGSAIDRFTVRNITFTT